MADHIDNSQRANDIIAGIEQRLGDVLAGAAERIQRALDEAEDVGGERAALVPTADRDTMDALVGMIREMLTGSLSVLGADAKARDIAQVLVANFRIALMDEGDDEATDPMRGPAR